jgi:hypothetical protein
LLLTSDNKQEEGVNMTFKVGESGNPSGRPRGTGYRQQLFNDFVMPHKNNLIDTGIKLALSGNETMLRLFLERLLPAKPTDDAITVEMPAIGANKAHTLSICGEAILQAVSQGNITPDQGKSMMAIIDAQRKNIEASDLALRLAEIERILKQRKEEK